MNKEQLNVQFCGFGGQGIVLSGVILGTTAVTKAGMNAVQTQSYGSEARGGECQSEVIVATQAIESPLADRTDILVAMCQEALNKYLPRLGSEGTLIYDPGLVKAPPAQNLSAIPVPATQMADEAGGKLAANMVMLGFLQQATGLFSPENLFDCIRENVRAEFFELNLKAVRMGIKLAQDGLVHIGI